MYFYYYEIEVVNGGFTIILFVVTNLVCVPKKRNLSIFRGLEGVWKHIRTLELKWKNRCNSSYFGNGKIFGARTQEEGLIRIILTWFWFLYFFKKTESGSSPTRIELNMLSQIFFMENLLYLDRENRTVLWNHVLLLESVVNPISDRSSWQLNPIFPIIFVSIIVWKEKKARLQVV